MRVTMGNSGTATDTRSYDAKSLIQAAEVRARQYQALGEQMRQLKQSFAQVSALGPAFKGKGADKIKAFYKAQETVTDAWLRVIDKQIAFLQGIPGEISDRNLSGATQVQIPFLESDLSIAYWRSRDIVSDQKESISRILHSISDLVPLQAFSTEDVERALDQADKEQTKMSEDVRDLDRTLLNEYQQVISDVPQIAALCSALENATRQGADVQPLHFNAQAFYNSEAYKIQGDLNKQAEAYLTFKKQQEQARKVSKKEEEEISWPWYGKAGTCIATFAGEMSGYYDFIRATKASIRKPAGNCRPASVRWPALQQPLCLFRLSAGPAARRSKAAKLSIRPLKHSTQRDIRWMRLASRNGQCRCSVKPKLACSR